MEPWTCRTCGVQHPSADEPPERCVICEDERQYVGVRGQEWATPAQLREEGHRGELHDLEPGLTAVEIRPALGIGQRALLVQTPAGNVLWDCVGYLDDDLVASVRARGGIAAIAVSHPHFYGAMVDWARAFGATLYLPEADRAWVVRQDANIAWWDDEVEVVPGVRVLQCGGHFDGSGVLHWAAGAEGRGVLLVGDTAMVVPDRRHLSFMRSYPNLIPLPPEAVRGIAGVLQRYPADRIYGAFAHREIRSGANEAITRSAERYVSWLAPPPDDDEHEAM